MFGDALEKCRMHGIRARTLPRVTSLAGTLVALWVLFLGSLPTPAYELWSSPAGDRYAFLNTALKWTSLLSYAPDDEQLYPERWSAASLWRFRLTAGAQPMSWLKAEVSYEQRARSVSEEAGAAGGSLFLVPEKRLPYRIEPVDEALVEVGSTFSYRHEIDRASVTARVGRSDFIVGRQAIGWGRGVLFSAVDIFSPFTPLEVDREWRRGVDALRGTIPLSDLISLELVAAFGEDGESSAYVGRLSGYQGDIDGELIVGRRGEDEMLAVTASFPVSGAEVHGELAVFKLPEDQPCGCVLGKDDLTAKTVLGGSYSFDLLGRLSTVVAEHHFSGFGVDDVDELPERLTSGDFLDRYLRGDFQTLGKHAAAVQLSYGIDGVAPVSLLWILNPQDGSGVVSPGVTWIFSDSVTLLGNVYLPYGGGPRDGHIQSEYGGTPTSGLIQINFYY